MPREGSGTSSWGDDVVDEKPAAWMIRLTEWMSSAQRRAGLKANGGMHILRHTFCSHLAMRGAPAKAIQELAGHASLSTTMRCTYLQEPRKGQSGCWTGARLRKFLEKLGDRKNPPTKTSADSEP